MLSYSKQLLFSILILLSTISFSQSKKTLQLKKEQIEKDIKWFEGMQPSTENMVVFIWEHVYKKIPDPARLHAIRLQETPTIFTEYFGPGE